MFQRALLLTAAMLAATAIGADADDGVTGKVELGYLATSGNTETSSLNTKLALGFEIATWRHSVTASAIKADDSGVTTAERYQFGAKSDYKFNEFDYLFATFNWEQDAFAGFDQRTSEAFGYGRRLLHSETHHLEAEIGVGARQTDFVLGANSDETILRLAGKYQWKVSESATFDQSLVMEKGGDNTYSESITALGAKIIGALNMKLSYTIKSNSDVMPGLKSMDTYTAVGIECSF